MAEIHSPDFYGDIKLATAAGSSGQKLTSAGTGVQATWVTPTISDSWTNNTLGITVDGVSATPLVMALVSSDANNLAVAGSDGRVYVPDASIPNKFIGTSASNTVHVLVHNLNNQFPDVTIYDTATNAVVIPQSVVGTDANTLTVTFALATAIAFTVVG